MGDPTETDQGRGRPSKVARLIDQYDLDGVGDDLERRWTADDPDERWSLRSLAVYFNQQLLERAVFDAGMQPLEGEIANLYRLLTDEDVSDADRTRATRQLEREGVDVDDLTDDFVSYQAVRTYLTNRGAEYSVETDRIASVQTTIQQLRNRTTTVVESKLDSVRSSDELTLGRFRVLVNVEVVCEDCSTQYDVGTLLDQGGCDCDGFS
jgi:hypothetical protein